MDYNYCQLYINIDNKINLAWRFKRNFTHEYLAGKFFEKKKKRRISNAKHNERSYNQKFREQNIRHRSGRTTSVYSRNVEKKK